MATKGSPQSKLAKLVVPCLEKIIKNASWRKHSKLVQDCKSVIEWLVQNPLPYGNIPAVPSKSETEPEAEELVEVVPSTSSPVDVEEKKELESTDPVEQIPDTNPTESVEVEEENSLSASVVTEDVKPIHSNVFALFDEGNNAISNEDAEMILHPLLVACETLSPKVVEPALDCFQKMIAHAHLRGVMEESSPVPSHVILVKILESVCRCYDMADETVELLVLKALLSAVTSTWVHVHGECLLKAIRTCYNIFLGTKIPVNQTTAKASLTQMLVIVCGRMEADSSTVPVQPIVVADLMEPADRSSSDQNVIQFVQNFITKVVQDIEVALAIPPDSFAHEGAFDPASPSFAGHVAHAKSNSMTESEGELLDAKFWEMGMLKQGHVHGLLEGDGEKEGEMEAQISNKLRRDAFLVFRALCKLSMKNPPQEGVLDPFAVRGKIVSLELLKIMLENTGVVFRTNERFLGAIKQYLCLSLLKNCASSLLTVFQLSCSIFFSLLNKFRVGLKAEIGVFFPMIVLRVLENVSQANFQQKLIVMRFLEKLCVDSQILVDLFVNYDCDVDSSNIFERLVNGLFKTAQSFSLGTESTLNPSQEAQLKLTAIKCLVAVLRSMADWTDKQMLVSESSLKGSELVIIEMPRDAKLSELQLEGGPGDFPTPSKADVLSPRSGADAATLEQRRAHKLEIQEGISIFNKKPAKGIQYLIKSKKIEEKPEDIAYFLKTAQGLNKTMIGDYLGEREDMAMKVMHAYVDSFDFQDQDFDEAIREFLNGFRLPGEAQKIDRIMEKFAERFCRCNTKAFTSADTAYVLAYSVIMLNTDAHNPMVKVKMSKADFLKNNRGIDDGNDIPEEFMGGLYDRIVQREIKMKEDVFYTEQQNQQKASNANNFSLESILNLVAGGGRTTTLTDTSDEVVKHMQEQLRAKSGKSGSVFYSASDVEIIRPLVEVVWAPMLAGFSVPLDNSDDEIVTIQCLEGFRYAIHVTAIMRMQTQRDAFITSLAKFTSLHSAADIKQKNIDAIKAIITIADKDGNYLHEAWEHILTCVSRFEHLHLVGEGAPSDATFFSAPLTEADKAKAVKAPSIRRKIPGKQAQFEKLARGGSYDSTGVGSQATGSVSAEQMSNLVSNLYLLEQVGSFEMSKIFTRSDRLNSEAIVEFVKALCRVSLEELRSPSDPRVFSLTKIVEIAHFNMTRIRLVWSKIWVVLADYFVTVGCMDNLRVAMYAIDSLRQLAMKFLEREELSNYNFQNEFLKPFVTVMRRSKSVEIRELIIRCVSQMIFARVSNVKSGWKTMFMVFTHAATDDQKTIVLLAFETIEKVVRDYFPYITETETTTFTDCVNCLIAFTNSRFNQDVSLNAIAFLRFCALKLAEGELGATALDKDGIGKKQQSQPVGDGVTFTDRDDHIYFWFPLLAGLSELTFDPRPDIRKSALEVLFDTLRFHGHMFSPALWERVFDSVLFPIFDYVRRASEPGPHSQQQHRLSLGSIDVDLQDDKEPLELEMDAWLYETCTLALQLVVDLFVKFYTKVSPLLIRILNLLAGFIKRPHQSLAAIGVAAFVRLMNNAGDLFADDKWQEVMDTLNDAALWTLPDMASIVRAADCEKDDSESPAPPRQVAAADAGGDEWAAEEPTSLAQCVADVRCKIAVQLLLVQAMSEIYGMHGTKLAPRFALILLDTLEAIASHAHKVNSDRLLRYRLQQLSSVTQMPDPPLLRLEGEAFHAYLTLLQRLPVEKPDLAKQVDVNLRLIKLCQEVVQVYVNTAGGGLTALAEEHKDETQVSHWAMPLGSARRRELVSRAPLVVATLRAISSFNEKDLEEYLPHVFPLLAQLVGSEHGSTEVQHTLSRLFSSKIGPILLQSR